MQEHVFWKLGGSSYCNVACSLRVRVIFTSMLMILFQYLWVVNFQYFTYLGLVGFLVAFSLFIYDALVTSQVAVWFWVGFMLSSFVDRFIRENIDYDDGVVKSRLRRGSCYGGFVYKLFYGGFGYELFVPLAFFFHKCLCGVM